MQWSQTHAAVRLVWFLFDAKSYQKHFYRKRIKILKACLSFLPLKKYSSSASVPASFSSSNSLCFIWSLIKYSSIISITFWINLILVWNLCDKKINEILKICRMWFQKGHFWIKIILRAAALEILPRRYFILF